MSIVVKAVCPLRWMYIETEWLTDCLKIDYLILGEGVLITGGLSDNKATQRKVELIDFRLGNICSLPKLPENYFAHTQNTLSNNKALLCGGFVPSTRNFCRKWNKRKGKFLRKPIHRFRTPWWDHVSWVNASDETFVLGGERTSNLTVFLKPGNFSAIKAYDTEYPSRYINILFLKILTVFF